VGTQSSRVLTADGEYPDGNKIIITARGSCCVTQPSLELKILLLQSLECWDHGM
jgi:hypothetical protein